MYAIAPFALAHTFDYGQFGNNLDLQHKAQNTLSNFLGFIGQTFDGLLSSGRALLELQQECIARCPGGKKIFDRWLASDDFGASRYIARSAMEIYAWFSKLPQRIQRLIRKNVQKWSVSALRQLTKVSTDLLKELVLSGKKTAAQVKAATKKTQANKATDVTTEEQEVAVIPELAPGVRVVVSQDNTGWLGYSGTIKKEFEGKGGGWWVSLDYFVADGSQMLKFFNTNCLQVEAEYLEQQQRLRSKRENAEQQKEKTYTQAEVDKIIADERKQWEQEKKEEYIGKSVELEDKAKQAVEDRLKALSSHAENLAKKKEELTRRVADLEDEVRKFRELKTENQVLKSEIIDLEKFLVKARESSRDNTLVPQALPGTVSKKDRLVAQLEVLVREQNQKLEYKDRQINELKELASQVENDVAESFNFPSQQVHFLELISQLGEVLGDKFNIRNWSRFGYRSIRGDRYQGSESIIMFCSEADRVLELLSF